MYNINKSLSNYIEMHKEKYSPKGEGIDALGEKKNNNKKKIRVDIDMEMAMSEIDKSLSSITKMVKSDLNKIAMLDGKLHDK